MPGLLSLPDGVLQSILTHVSLNDRLGSCSLVHTRLHAAAVAATQHVESGRPHRTLKEQHAQSVLSWLSRHGQHVTSLTMWDAPRWLDELESCTNLLDLRLNGGCVRLGPTAPGSPGVLEVLTKLTRLEFHATLIDCDAVDDSLSRLVHLKHLHAPGELLSPATLPRLTGLTYLCNHSMSLGTLRQLGALTELRELDCMAAYGVTANPSRVTGLVLPPTLTKLQLATNSKKGVEIALLPLAPPGLRSLRVDWYDRRTPMGPDWLLASIGHLQCLEALELFPSLAWPPPGPAYSALTASSSLVHLTLVASPPAGVWPFVFRASHRLPHLTSLVFDSEWDEDAVPWAFGAADLAALVSCCPGLCEISYLGLVHGAHVAELQKLTALTRLQCFFEADGDAAGTIKGFAAATQLQDLIADLGTPSVAVSVASLLPLTSLTALTSFCCAWCHEDDPDSCGAHISTQAGSPPDVWLQLLERCAAEDPGCQPTALRSLAQQLSAQAQQIAGLQAQLSDQQQRNKVLQQQHAAAQQQLAVHQGLLSAQQQVVAGQGARMAALEGTLQQLLQRLP